MSAPTPSLPRRFVLAPGVHAVAIADDLVFLDVAADAYACLPGAAGRVRLAADRRGVAVDDPGLADELSAAGLIQPGDGALEAGAAARSPPRPASSPVGVAAGAPQWGDLPQAIGCLWDLFLHYRGRRFAEILACAAPRSGARSRGPRAELLAVAARFHRWIPYAPVSGKCLLRSFMLLRLLRREGHDARWVFGVRTWPFGAHCWLQAGDVVLDDHHELLVALHPILVL